VKVDVTGMMTKLTAPGEVQLQLMDKKGKSKAGILVVLMRVVRGHDIMVKALNELTAIAASQESLSSPSSRNRLASKAK
jgi:hypothetical protein